MFTIFFYRLTRMELHRRYSLYKQAQYKERMRQRNIIFAREAAFHKAAALKAAALKAAVPTDKKL